MSSYQAPHNAEHRADVRILLSLVIILTTIGLLFIYAASSVYALERFGTSSYFLKKQFHGVITALGAFLIMRYLPLTLLRAISPACLAVSIFLTAATFIPYLAVTIHGSSRWLSLLGFTFQPSELIMLWTIPFVAHVLSKREHARRFHNKNLIVTIAVVGFAALILLMQPDFGMAFSLVLTSLLMLFIGHIDMIYFFITCAAFVPISLLLVALKPYRLQRILTFLNPWGDPRGGGFQIIQSLIAIGSGGWTGLGIGQSKQKFFYLPMQHTDFIFSIIVEESGMVGALIIIGLYVSMLYVGIRVAWRQQDTFGTLMTFGFIFLLSLKALIHLGVTTGLLPPKGMGLPLISYGKSSLVSTFAMLGLIANAAYNRS